MLHFYSKSLCFYPITNIIVGDPRPSSTTTPLIYHRHHLLMFQLIRCRSFSCPRSIAEAVVGCPSPRLAAACTPGWMSPCPITTLIFAIFPSRLLVRGKGRVTAPVDHTEGAGASPALPALTPASVLFSTPSSAVFPSAVGIV